MRKLLCLLLPLLLSVVLSTQAQTPSDTITQFSTYGSLSAGNYEGAMKAEDIMARGKIGIGTFDGLDGEMIIVDSELFQVKENGDVMHADTSVKIPFATVGTIKQDNYIKLAPESTYEDFKKNIEKRLSSPNTMCIIRIEGYFKSVQLRSVAKQVVPYPPLETALGGQKLSYAFKRHGIMVGFYMPGFLRDIVSPGIHMHFIASDRKKGGHVLDFVVEKASMTLEEKSEFDLILPGVESFKKMDFSKIAAAAPAKSAPVPDLKKITAPVKEVDVAEPPPPPPAPKQPAPKQPAPAPAAPAAK